MSPPFFVVRESRANQLRLSLLGWRINVNRPTELRYPAGEIEIDSKRAKEVYQNFKHAVFNVSHGSLDLYIDLHQNGRQKNIEIATVGVTNDQAQFVKNTYRKIRDQILQNAPDVEAVELAIEPLDAIEIGAWGAKAEGILSVAKQSLHIELPAYRILGTANAREAYQSILAVLLDHSAEFLLSPAQRWADIRPVRQVSGATVKPAQDH